MRTFQQFLEAKELQDLVGLDDENWLDRLKRFLKRREEGSSVTDPAKSIAPGELSAYGKQSSFQPIKPEKMDTSDLISLADEDWEELGSTMDYGSRLRRQQNAEKTQAGFKNPQF